MQPLKQFQRPKLVFLLGLLACSSRVLAESTQTGRCASCTPVDSSGTCPGMLPVCVDNSSGDTNNLPCAELIPGTYQAYGINTAAQVQQSTAQLQQNIQQNMPSWIQQSMPQINQPAMQQVPAPSAAELAAARCPTNKPSKMCCSASAFGQSTEATGQQTGNSSTGGTQNQATATRTTVNSAPGASQQLATQQSTPAPAPAPGQGTAVQAATVPKGSAANVQSSVLVVAAASFGAALLLQLL